MYGSLRTVSTELDKHSYEQNMKLAVDFMNKNEHYLEKTRHLSGQKWSMHNRFASHAHDSVRIFMEIKLITLEALQLVYKIYAICMYVVSCFEIF